MVGIVAIVAALLFVGSALYRFTPAAPRAMRNVQLAFALVAGLFGIATYKATGDSRWLVGGVLLLGAGFPGWAAGNRRALTITALILGVLGTALCGIALSKPMALAPVAIDKGGVSGSAG